ncbi:MAG TPA: hypothetical protein EYH30_03665 [Anaerolineales bacterium]|nr:hypothetical protein [Anaerolineae bacterium]HIQ01218.1 hypothetical protein [Anaerolineales bacterium]
MVELLSILILTFSLTMVLLGLITLWLERGPGRWQGVVVSLLGLLVGAGYAFLGSRFSLALFGRLIVRVNLPALMATAITYTVGVLAGVALAVGLFLWVTGRYHAWQIRRRVLALVLTAVLLAVLFTFLAVWLSRLPA